MVETVSSCIKETNDVFDEYDQLKLQEAKRLITEVYEFNYGAPRMSRKIKKLETISELLGNKLPSFRNLPWRSQVGDLLLFLLDRVTYYGMTATMRPVVRQAIPGEPPVLFAVIVRPSPEATPHGNVQLYKYAPPHSLY